MSLGDWIIGCEPDGQREYLIHRTFPRFIARVVPADLDGSPLEACDQDVDLISDYTFSTSVGEIICEIDWLDDLSALEDARGHIKELFFEADQALEKYSETHEI